jgi:hypothetical protein
MRLSPIAAYWIMGAALKQRPRVVASLPGEPIAVALQTTLRKTPNTMLVLELASVVSLIWGGAGLNGILLRAASGVGVPMMLPMVVLGQFTVASLTMFRSLAVQRHVNLLYYLQHGRPLFGLPPSSKIARHFRNEVLPLLQAQEKRVSQTLTATGGILGERAGKTLATAQGWGGYREALTRLLGAGTGVMGGHQVARVVNAGHRRTVQQQVLAALKLI